ALDRAVVLARPVPTDQVHVTGVGLVQGGVVQNQESVVAADLGLGLKPEVFGVGLQACQQTVEGVVSGRSGLDGLDACGLGAGELPWGSQQKLDVVFRLYFRGIHTLFYAHKTSAEE